MRDGGHLSLVWAPGARLYRGLGRIDAARGVASWDEALDWLGRHESISEIQYWGHGKWGSARVDDDVLDGASIETRHRKPLEAIRERLAADALVWFRTCETFGAQAGHDFAQRLADSEAKVAITVESSLRRGRAIPMRAILEDARRDAPSLEHVVVAPFDELSDPQVTAGLAARAEERGWDGFFVWDHIQYRAPVSAVADPWVTLAAVATATERVRGKRPNGNLVVRRNPDRR